jgi:hypothetical protein
VNVRIVVPRRSDGGHRDALWKHVRDWWSSAFPDWKIVEGHHDHGPFNRSAAINRAADQAGECDVLVVADADVVAEPHQLQAAMEMATKTGRMCFAFDKYHYLSESSTRRALEGERRALLDRPLSQRPVHLSSLQVVPRALWERVGGFDDRFVGWGAEDDAFAAACRVLGGGIDRIAGIAAHLWHQTAARTRTPEYTQNVALLRRYQAAVQPAEMRRMSIGRWVIVDDSGDAEYQAWLRWNFPDFELACTPQRQGFAKAVRFAREIALASGQPWIWWHEDDFVLNGPTDLAAMAGLLEANPQLQQLALLRQAWWQGEIDAGGIIPERADKFTQRDGYVEHALFWTQNPHLVSRAQLAAHDWPVGANSEARYGHQVLQGGKVSGFLGVRTDPPRVTHVGDIRKGSGY